MEQTNIDDIGVVTKEEDHENLVSQVTKETLSYLDEIAKSKGMTAKGYQDTIRQVVKIPEGGGRSREMTGPEFAQFISTAARLKLDPMVGQIYAFPKKGGGGIQIIVAIDGWLKVINERPEFDHLETEELRDNGEVYAITAKIFKKSVSKPTIVTEYMQECRDNSKIPWQRWPIRMLRHKAVIQCARYAFGLGDVIDSDEAERWASVGTLIAPGMGKEVKPDSTPEIESGQRTETPISHPEPPSNGQTERMMTGNQRKTMYGTWKQLTGRKVPDGERDESLMLFLNERQTPFTELTFEQARELLDKWLRKDGEGNKDPDDSEVKTFMENYPDYFIREPVWICECGFENFDGRRKTCPECNKKQGE
jgi:hypothetical protein